MYPCFIFRKISGSNLILVTTLWRISWFSSVPSTKRKDTLISGFRCSVEICAHLGYYAASCGNCLPTFRDNESVPYSRVKRIPFSPKIGLKFKEETTAMLHLEHSFVWCWNVDILVSRSEVSGKFWDVVLEKNRQDQLDRSSEKWRSITLGQSGKEHSTNNKEEKGCLDLQHLAYELPSKTPAEGKADGSYGKTR